MIMRDIPELVRPSTGTMIVVDGLTNVGAAAREQIMLLSILQISIEQPRLMYLTTILRSLLAPCSFLHLSPIFRI